MSFIYPRLVSVERPVIGADMQQEKLSYAAVSGLNNLKASIQFKAITGRPNTDLPADPSNETYWAIFIPFSQSGGVITRGLIKLRDVVIDDTDLRYEAVGPYWNSLGYNLRCKLLAP
jgi:hypothetical protein